MIRVTYPQIFCDTNSNIDIITVYWLHYTRMKLETRGRPRKEKRNQKILALKKKGLTFKQIGEKLGIGLSTVSDIYYLYTKKGGKKLST